MSANKPYKYIRLGDIIEKFSLKNKENLSYVSGVNIFKEFISTVADLNGTDISKYQVVPKDCFACNLMHIGRDAKIPIAFNHSSHSVIVSPAYETFKVKSEKTSIVLSDYLIMIFKCREIDRLSWFYCDSSIRGNLQWDRFCDIQIPLPSIEVQRELVDAYKGLKELAETNEAMLQPLQEACHAFILNCIRKYNSVKLNDYIEESKEKNIDNKVTLTQGVDVNLQFIPAKREAADSEGTKIVRTGQFAFNKVVKSNGTKLPIALRKGPDCIISSSYAVFYITKDNLLSDFLMLYFSRPEFHRFCGYMSQGTTRDIFDFSLLQEVEIPLPPLDIQQKIADLYNCYEECKRIATEAREQLKTICPALVQKAAHSIA